MIKDFFVSFRDNFKEKTTNPFLGTYLLVWLVTNWVLVYSLFNFDSNSTLQYRVDFIQSYYKQHNFICNLVSNIGISIAVLFVTYILLNISRLIVNCFDKMVTPWIYKITDKSSVVLKHVYEEVKTERDDLQSRLEQERDSKAKLELRIKHLEEELSKQKPIIDNSQDEVDVMVKKLVDSKLDNHFLDIVLSIKQHEYIKKTTYGLNEFLKLGLIEFKSESLEITKALYELTTLGINVHQKLALID